MYKPSNKVIPWALLGCLFALPAAARPPQISPPDANGFRWATVTHPGNRLPNAVEGPGFYQEVPLLLQPRGRVDSSYRIAQTELTLGQYLPFLRAFEPFIGNRPILGGLSPSWITILQEPGPNGSRFDVAPERLNWPANISWEYAARFSNWMHNGRAATPEAFESGVYDLSTLQYSQYGNPISGNVTRALGATFWIPSIDEWIKAMYYDPNRYGEGEEGYWRYPIASDSQPIPGLPSEGGQTLVGALEWLIRPPLPVGSYPNVRSPWGLLDGSGSLPELTDTGYLGPVNTELVFRLGEIQGAPVQGDPEILGIGGVDFIGGREGVRFASAVPSPGAAVGVVLFGSMRLARRKR